MGVSARGSSLGVLEVFIAAGSTGKGSRAKIESHTIPAYRGEERGALPDAHIGGHALPGRPGHQSKMLNADATDAAQAVKVPDLSLTPLIPES